MNRLYIIAVGGLVSIGVLGFEEASAQSPRTGGMRARNFQGGAVRGFGPSMGGLGAHNLRGFGPTMGGMGARNFRGFGPAMGGMGARNFQGGTARGFGPTTGAGYGAAPFTNTPRAHMPSSRGFARPGSPASQETREGAEVAIASEVQRKVSEAAALALTLLGKATTALPPIVQLATEPPTMMLRRAETLKNAPSPEPRSGHRMAAIAG